MRAILFSGLALALVGCEAQTPAAPVPVKPAAVQELPDFSAAAVPSFTAGPPIGYTPSRWDVTFSSTYYGPASMTLFGGGGHWSNGIGTSAVGIGPGRSFVIVYDTNGAANPPPATTMHFAVIDGNIGSSHVGGSGPVPIAQISGLPIGNGVLVDLTPVP